MWISTPHIDWDMIASVAGVARITTSVHSFFPGSICQTSPKMARVSHWLCKKIGKPDPEIYVDDGKWKARQGGNGLASAGDVKIRFTNCTTEDHAKIYRLVRPFDDELVGMFVPFGKLPQSLVRSSFGKPLSLRLGLMCLYCQSNLLIKMATITR